MKKSNYRLLSCLCILSLLLATIPLPVNAQGIGDEQFIKVDIEDILSDEQLEAFYAESYAIEQAESEKGYSLVSREVYIPAVMPLSHTPYYVNVKDTYTSDPVVMNDRSAGMLYWLDVIWNVFVGETTKYAWIAATVLGIEPSAFSSSYRSGDTLTNTTTKVYNRKCYYMYNDHSEHDVLYYETYKLVITEYVDLYTSTSDGTPYRDSGSETYTFYTEHYHDTAWIRNYVINACNNGLLFQRDQIP